MDKNWENVRNFGHNQPYFQKNKKFKTLFHGILDTRVNVQLDQISAF